LCFCDRQFIVRLLLLRTGMRADVNVVLPIRQTASIFKQPVTIVSNHPESKTRTDLRHGTQEQPRQVTYHSGLSPPAPVFSKDRPKVWNFSFGRNRKSHRKRDTTFGRNRNYTERDHLLSAETETESACDL